MSMFYHIGGIFWGENFREFHVLEKIIHRKHKIYMVNYLFLTDSWNFNPAKYTTYKIFYVAAQTWCLCRLLPLMIGDKIPDYDLRWHYITKTTALIYTTHNYALTQPHLCYNPSTA